MNWNMNSSDIKTVEIFAIKFDALTSTILERWATSRMQM